MPVSLEVAHNVILTIPHSKIKDVFDERRRITCFRISPRTGLVMARGEMLKQVQHDVEGIELAHKVILNLFQDLSAVKENRGS